MKIIKNGTLYPKRISCPKCHSLLEYTSEDKEIIYNNTVFISSNPQIPGSNRIHKSLIRYVVECPVCGHVITLADGYSTYTNYKDTKLNEKITIENNYESPDHVEVENE